MAIIVVDASLALAWCFEDEANSLADTLLKRLRQDDSIFVPAHWVAEISSGLLVAQRRKRIKAGDAARFLDEFSRLPIEAEPPLTTMQAKTILALSDKHGLTVYDAYLELAQRRQLPLGTLDTDLRKASAVEGVRLL